MLSTAVGLAVALSGGSGFTVNLNSRTVHDTEFTPTNALAGFRLGTDGKIYTAEQTGNSNYAEVVGVQWLDPKDAAEADNYEAFATLISGTLTTGTTGSWLDLAADQTWTRDRTSDVTAVSTCVITIDIRRKGTGTNLVTATITLEAEVA